MVAKSSEVLDLLAESDADALSTSEVAIALGISQPGAWRRLEKLVESGLVVRTTSEDAMTDWWTLSEDAEEQLEE